MKRTIRTNNGLQNTTKTKDWATRIPIKQEANSAISEWEALPAFLWHPYSHSCSKSCDKSLTMLFDCTLIAKVKLMTQFEEY